MSVGRRARSKRSGPIKVRKKAKEKAKKKTARGALRPCRPCMRPTSPQGERCKGAQGLCGPARAVMPGPGGPTLAKGALFPLPLAGVAVVRDSGLRAGPCVCLVSSRGPGPCVCVWSPRGPGPRPLGPQPSGAQGHCTLCLPLCSRQRLGIL